MKELTGQRDERDLLRAIMEHSRASLVYLDTGFRILSVNHAYEVACQRSRAEMIGRNHFDLFPNPENEAIFRRVVSSGQSVEFEARPFEFVDQAWRGVTYWDWTLAPVKDDDGLVEGLILSLIDVTERVREIHLRDTLDACSSMVNATRDFDGLMQLVLVLAQPALRCESAVLLLAEDNGWTTSAVSGKTMALAGRRFEVGELPVVAALAEDRSPRWVVAGPDCDLSIFNAGGEAVTRACFAVPLLHHDASIGALLFNYSESQWQPGASEIEFAQRLATLVALAHENCRLDEVERQAMLDLRRANEELDQRVRERTAELEAVFSSLPDAVYVGNEDGIYRCNQAALDALGCTTIADLEEAIPRLAEKVNTRYADTGARVPPDQEPFIRALRGEAATLDMILRNLKTGSDVTVRSACAPIMYNGRVIGAVAVNTDITKARRAEAELRAHREQLQNLSRRLVEIQETERQYIARQLYDDEGQRLSALLVQMRLLQRELACSPEVTSRLDEMKHLASGILQDMHGLAVGLRPASLDRLGLAHALREYVARFGQYHKLEAQSDCLGLDGVFLGQAVETAIFRIVQEALGNVAQHARATHVAVLVQKRDHLVTAIVEDDGEGFDVSRAFTEGQTGLIAMRERAESLGGSVTIESTPLEGTTVYFEAPLE